ncbi:SMP-30/gluconolactonase/LRE family protein [Mycobacterium sp. Y57]|uniref:SMP-30/gluconolactonase/LRE family protein n=1 Tax=Mycolicibacterium xanthum TaxID=2796469 RepID=UPI001C855C5D|nr:SMP-30/gluconolactonase/LRE family protein [Mycolicibacterium xanthum]MBX7430529.1 SMP-30/gluconolactonase/LRE family protein [Mycolicibacterium xanthum]
MVTQTIGSATSGPRRSLAPLAGGFCFGVSPRWFEGLLWFSDAPGNAVHTVDLRGSMTTLPLAGHAPHGLGFRPDGSLLISSSGDRQILRYDGETIATLADLGDTAPADLGDMVVDDRGRAYVGCQAPATGAIVRLDPDGNAVVCAGGMDFPTGMVITPDRQTLIVAESTGRRLTAFTIKPDGSLSDRRVFADHLDGPPGGIALDADGGVWTSMTRAHQFQRVTAGGAVTDRVDFTERSAVACTLGGPQRRTLFMLSSTDTEPERLIGSQLSRLDALVVDIPGAGLP